jgi:hypothetical protein
MTTGEKWRPGLGRRTIRIGVVVQTGSHGRSPLLFDVHYGLSVGPELKAPQIFDTSRIAEQVGADPPSRGRILRTPDSGVDILIA